MVFRTPHSSALSPGSDTWLISNFEDSYWAQRIDWYMNFQLNQRHRHPMAELSEKVENMIDELGLVHYAFNVKNTAPILVGSSGHLPNKKTIQLPQNADSQDWLMRAHKTWESLGRPSMRIFLPRTMSYDEALIFWEPVSQGSTISLVPPLAPSAPHPSHSNSMVLHP